MTGALAWRLPLALASFLFNRLCRFVLRALLVAGSTVSRRSFGQWRVTSSATLATPLFVPLVMTTGPRWNAHALTANVGPLRLRYTLRINVGALHRAGAAWSLTGYTVPDFVDRIFVSSGDDPASRDWLDLAVKPGRYLLGVRLYQPSLSAALPELIIDGDRVVPAKSFPPDANAFLPELVRRSRWFYFWLQYYVQVMLQYAQWLPAGWVRREFLPVGNASTRFEFGLLSPQCPLRVEVSEKIVATCKVYVTAYDRRSFPLAWRTLESRIEVLPGLTGSAYYLLRCQALSRQASTVGRLEAKVIDRETSSTAWDQRCD
jgi:Family of unknown function (DUF6208)